MSPGKKVAPPLPVEFWVQGQGFQFGAPFGWRQLNGNELNNRALAQGAFLHAGVRAIRTDNPATEVLAGWTDFPANKREFTAGMWVLANKRAEVVARTNLRTLVAPFQRISVGGNVAMLLEFRGIESGAAWGEGAVAGVYTEVYAYCNRYKRVCLISLCGREENHAPYLAGFHTMLASWQWI